ncbi:MAG TPA: hypothetical protein VEH79_00225 [Gaiellaceae bacterium]|nr:hypothetical protein [Gaiellaceae bacterium]
MTRAKLRRVFWIGAATILVLAALIAIAAIVAGGFSSTDGRILASLGSVLLAGATAFSGLALVEGRTVPALGWASAAVGAVGLMVMLAAIWSGSDTMGRSAGTAAVTLAGLLLASTNRLLLRLASLSSVWGATLGAISIATLLTVISIWSGGGHPGLAKTIAAFWILAGLGWLLVPVLQRTALASAVTAVAPPADRIVATLGDIEALTTAAPQEGDLVVDVSSLAPGEQLVLRRRSTG